MQKGKESMAVRPPDQRGAPLLQSAKSHAQVAAFCGLIGVEWPYSPRLYGLLCLGIPGLAASPGRGQGAILAGCMTKGLPKGRSFVFGLVLLPSAAAQFGCSVTLPRHWARVMVYHTRSSEAPGASPPETGTGVPARDRGKRRAYIGLFLPPGEHIALSFSWENFCFSFPREPFFPPDFFGLSFL